MYKLTEVESLSLGDTVRMPYLNRVDGEFVTTYKQFTVTEIDKYTRNVTVTRADGFNCTLQHTNTIEKEY